MAGRTRRAKKSSEFRTECAEEDNSVHPAKGSNGQKPVDGTEKIESMAMDNSSKSAKIVEIKPMYNDASASTSNDKDGVEERQTHKILEIKPIKITSGSDYGDIDPKVPEMNTEQPVLNARISNKGTDIVGVCFGDENVIISDNVQDDVDMTEVINAIEKGKGKEKRQNSVMEISDSEESGSPLFVDLANESANDSNSCSVTSESADTTMEEELRKTPGDRGPKDKPKKCNECGRKYLRRGTLMPPYICDPCNTTGQKVTETGETFYECAICSKRYFRNSAFMKHMATHKNVKNVTCETCGARFPNEQSLRKHEESDCSSSTKCRFCLKTFEKHAMLKMHMRQCSGNKDSGHTCQICGRIYSNPDMLRTHMRDHQEKQFFCIFCHKTFSTAKYLQFHMTTHSKEVPKREKVDDSLNTSELFDINSLASYQCDVCNVRFVKLSDFESHKRDFDHKQGTGYSKKPGNPGGNFKCQICEKEFLSEADLKYHLVNHPDDKPFKCQICGKRSDMLSTHKMHMLTNHMENTCETCGRAFTTLGALKQHVTVHQPTKILACQVCGLTFTRHGELHRHNLTHKY